MVKRIIYILAMDPGKVAPPSSSQLVKTKNGIWVNRAQRTIVLSDEWESWSDKCKQWYERGIRSTGLDKQVWVYTHDGLINCEDKAYVKVEDDAILIFYEAPTSKFDDLPREFFSFDEEDEWVFNK